jgi:hypothetical protein
MVARIKQGQAPDTETAGIIAHLVGRAEAAMFNKISRWEDNDVARVKARVAVIALYFSKGGDIVGWAARPDGHEGTTAGGTLERDWLAFGGGDRAAAGKRLLAAGAKKFRVYRRDMQGRFFYEHGDSL